MSTRPSTALDVSVAFVPCPNSYNFCVSTDFLDRLASQLRANKSAACRRAIQRILAFVKKNFEDGKYKNDVEAEADFRQLVDRDEGRTR
jgi:hypothetical protein